MVNGLCAGLKLSKLGQRFGFEYPSAEMALLKPPWDARKGTQRWQTLFGAFHLLLLGSGEV